MKHTCEKPKISAKGKNHKSMKLNKLQLNSMDLKKCKSVPVEKQATVKYFTASTRMLNQLQLTNKSSKSLSKSHCDPGGN